MENQQCMKFNEVSVNLGETRILHDVSGCAKSGEVLAIMGPSGKLLLAIFGVRQWKYIQVLFVTNRGRFPLPRYSQRTCMIIKQKT